MDTELDPVVGNWYRHLDKGELFRVVAYDEDRGMVELQHFDGDIEEMDASDWFDMNIEPAEAPEDWTGPADSTETDDPAYDKAAKPRPPLDERESGEEEWEDEGPEKDHDEWDEDDSDEDSDSDFDEPDSDR